MPASSSAPWPALRVTYHVKASNEPDLDARVDEFVDRLHSGAQQAIRWTKVSVNIGLKQLASSILDASLGYELLTNYTDDHREAVAAFSNKRKPVFGGAS